MFSAPQPPHDVTTTQTSELDPSARRQVFADIQRRLAALVATTTALRSWQRATPPQDGGGGPLSTQELDVRIDVP